MFVERVLSFNDGWSVLTTQKSKEWEDISIALEMMKADDVVEKVADSIISGKNKQTSDKDYFVYYTYALFLLYLNAVDKEWPKEFLKENKFSVTSSVFISRKNGVATSMVGLDEKTGGDLITNIFLKIPYYFNAGLCEITVLLIPTQSIIDQLLSSGINSELLQDIPTEEKCREQLVKFGPQSSLAPAVIVFYSPKEAREPIIEEVVPIKVDVPIIERTIEFAPEFYQAGVGLLSYFGEILRQKDPNTKAKVRIEQEGNTVRLHIVPPVGEAEIVEKQLEQFALIVSGQASPDLLLDNPGQIVQLKAQLRVAQMQIENAYDLKQLTAGKHAQDIHNLENKIDALTQQIANRVLDQGNNYELL